MRKLIGVWVVIAAVSGSLVGPVSIAGAQDATVVASDETGKKLEESARELIASITEQQQELEGLGETISQATKEDVRALRERGIDLIDVYVSDLGTLEANILKREKRGMDASGDRALATDLRQSLSTVLRTSVKSTQSELQALRASKEDAPPDEFEQIESVLALENIWLDRSFGIFLEHIEAMDRFSLDSSDERELLTTMLTGRAELVSGRIMLTRDTLSKIQRRLRADPSNAEFNTDLDLANTQLDVYVERLATTIRIMGALGLDTAEYQQLLFEVTGEITTGLLSRDVAAGIFRGWVDSVTQWIAHNGPTIVLKVFLFVLILFVFRVLAKIARKIVKKAIKTSNLEFSTLLERTALSMTGSLVMLFGLLVALSQLGFQVGPLLAGLGVVGFIVGFALQDTLSNFASGVMILLYRPYDVGDLIETAGAIGKVKNMTLVSTTILTVDHQTLVIPNSMIWGNVIKNVTAQTERRVDMVFGIGYADDIPHAERVLTEILVAHGKVLDDPEPVVKLHNLGDSSVDFVVRPWVATDDYWEVYWDITREVKMRFDAEGISIPFPQRDVHVFREGE